MSQKIKTCLKISSSVFLTFVASALIVMNTFTIGTNVFSITAWVDSEIPVSIDKVHVRWIHPEAPIPSSITMVSDLVSISMIGVSFALVGSLTNVFMIGANMMRNFTYIVPLVSIGRIGTWGIDPEVVVPGCISVITKLMTLASVFFHTIGKSLAFNKVVAYSFSSEVPLRINNTFLRRIHPEFVTS